MPRKLIIDTDPGIDDAMAIYLALASPELDIVGLTTVFGNVHVDLATTNALRLLEIAGRGDIPVAEGAAGPIASEYHGPIPHIHGTDGQGDTHLPPPVATACGKSAVEFLIEASQGERPLTILALGPLTNLAIALRQDPGLADRVEEVVIMGGNALGPGNATPAAEANIWCDPEAADFVLGCFDRLTMVGLDVTHEVVMSGDEIATLDQSASTTARHLGAVVSKYLDFFRQNQDRDGIIIHDPYRGGLPDRSRPLHHPTMADPGRGRRYQPRQDLAVSGHQRPGPRTVAGTTARRRLRRSRGATGQQPGA